MSKSDRMTDKAALFIQEGRYDKAAACYLKAIKALSEAPKQQKALAAEFVMLLIDHISEPELLGAGLGVTAYIRYYNAEFVPVRDRLREGLGCFIGLSEYISSLRGRLGIPREDRSVEDLVRLMTSYTFSDNPRYFMFFYYLCEYMYLVRGNIRLWRCQLPPCEQFKSIVRRFVEGEGHGSILDDLAPYLEDFSQPEAFTMAYEIYSANGFNREAAFYWLIASSMDISASLFITERCTACESGRGRHIERFYKALTDSRDKFPQKAVIEDCVRMWMMRAYQCEEAKGSKYAAYRLAESLGLSMDACELLRREDYPEAVIRSGKWLFDEPWGKFYDYCTYGELDRHPDVKEEAQTVLDQAVRLRLPIADTWAPEHKRLLRKNGFLYEKRPVGNFGMTSKPDPIQAQMDEYKRHLEDMERLAGLFSDGAPLSLEEREAYARSTLDMDTLTSTILLENAKSDHLKRKREKLIEEQQSSGYGSYDSYYSSSDKSEKEEEEPPKELTLEEIRRKESKVRSDMSGSESWFAFEAPLCVTRSVTAYSSSLSADEALKLDFEDWIKEQAGDTE